ncbi:hypothetical protein FACS1894199_12780 [Bacteroidia bacterium]|nr:hypothetical protein FACS1894199_12780 [Bacteroidia bacterium]
MNDFLVNIGCFSLNFRELDENSLQILDSAGFYDTKIALEKFKKSLNFKIEQLSIVQKCNAVIIIVAFDKTVPSDLLKKE